MFDLRRTAGYEGFQRAKQAIDHLRLNRRSSVPSTTALSSRSGTQLVDEYFMDRDLAREVLRRIPKYLDRPNVLGIGEIGLNRVTRNELATFRDHVELALEHDQMIHVHTPHLEDKYKGTLDAGVREYWIIDLDAQSIERWTAGHASPTVESTRLVWAPAGSASALVIDVPDPFGRIRDSWR